MDNQTYIAQAEQDLLHTYNRYGVIFEYGKDVYLFDTAGKKYLDFAAGIGVCALGYGNEEYEDAVKDQVDQLLHTSNLFYNLPAVKAAALVKKISGMDRVFFTNSGTEAIEGAIKAARKYAFTKDGGTDHEIIAMEKSFHGRSLGALAVTGNSHYREPFEPLMQGVRFARFNDLDSVKALVNEKTCAVLMETVQGEGGIYPAKQEFIEGVAALCKENDILLVLDEIQCGMGRSGEMFAWQNYGVKPDIMAVAKALGGGVPVGAFLMTERVAEKSLVPGDHGTTYGGNPLVCAAVAKTIEMMLRDRIADHVQKVAGYLWNRLDELKAKHGCIVEHRGLGLMQGLELSIPAGEVSKAALEKGLIVITAGGNVLRFLPPLVIEEEHVDKMIQILDGVLQAYT